MQPAHPGRAHGHRSRHRDRSGRGAVPHRLWRDTGRPRPRRPGRRPNAAWLCRAGAGDRDRGRDHHRLPRASRAGRAGRRLQLPRPRAAAAIRPDVRQGHRRVQFDRLPGFGAAAHDPRAGRVPDRRPADQPRLATGDPRPVRTRGGRRSHHPARRAPRADRAVPVDTRLGRQDPIGSAGGCPQWRALVDHPGADRRSFARRP